MDFILGNIEIIIGLALAAYIIKAIATHKTPDQKMEEWIHNPENDAWAYHLGKQTDRTRKSIRQDYSPKRLGKAKLIWRCDLYDFLFYDVAKPYLEIVDFRTDEAFVTVGKDGEFADYDVSNVEMAMRSGLQILKSKNIPVTYGGSSDEQLDCNFGEYGSKPQYLNP